MSSVKWIGLNQMKGTMLIWIGKILGMCSLTVEYCEWLSLLCCRAEMQIATTQDYATDSWFWNMMTGVCVHVHA